MSISSLLPFVLCYTQLFQLHMISKNKNDSTWKETKYLPCSFRTFCNLGTNAHDAFFPLLVFDFAQQRKFACNPITWLRLLSDDRSSREWLKLHKKQLGTLPVPSPTHLPGLYVPDCLHSTVQAPRHFAPQLYNIYTLRAEPPRRKIKKWMCKEELINKLSCISLVIKIFGL